MPPRPFEGRTVVFKTNFVDVKPEKLNEGHPNKICTTRFTLLTWLPLSLWTQFHRVANVYFLVVSITVLLPFSPVMPASTALPFVGVLLWTALKDLYEDRKRKQDDDQVNLTSCFRYNLETGEFVGVNWQNVLCGDLILCVPDDEFPADMLVVGGEGGQAFISTMNLDGETNLKERRPPAVCSALAPSQSDAADEPFAQAAHLAKTLVAQQGLTATLDAPSAPLAEMNGTVKFSFLSTSSSNKLEEMKVASDSALSYENFVPRGCKLQQTAWMLGLVAYTCPDSKVWLNTSELEVKVSNLQVALNKCVLGLVVTLFVFCLYAALLGQVVGTDDEAVEYPKKFVIYWIILYQIVPVSLYVVFEMVKLLLGRAINKDKQMCADGIHAKARTSDLVEELGQVEHVFSDKTGTLTQNEMRFARCYVGKDDLGEFRDIPAPGLEGVVASQSKPPGVKIARQIMLDSGHDLCHDVQNFFLCLATCHDVQVERNAETGVPEFSGSSADEVAFLEASHQVGMSLQSRAALPGSAGATLGIMTPMGETLTVDVLCMIPFDSDRKRMTVVCKIDNQILCVTKGADTTMEPLCRCIKGHVQEQLRAYASLGLRTLVIARKVLTEKEFEPWRLEYEAARSAGGAEKDRLMAECASKMECSLDFCGLTAIEDRLQDGVPEAVAKLNAMNVHVWMLTGDKTETAIEIAKSCNLVKGDQPLVRLADAPSKDVALKMLEEAHRDICGGSSGSQKALVLDGAFMLFVARLQEEAPGPQDLLTQTAMAAAACVCCRLSPKQKRSLVEMVKAAGAGRITLAIGDGANDVAMIQGAHVGVAVRGREGTQAVQACDVAISQFRFLLPLLQCHGRRAYRRVSLYLCYFIYKHVALAVGDMLWAHQDSFRGRIGYPDWLSSAYPIVFTTLPVLVIVVMDEDLPDAVALSKPSLYTMGQQRVHFNAMVFISWILSGIWHGGLAWLLPSLVVDNGKLDSDLDNEFWTASLVSFTLVMAHVSLRLWLVSMSAFSKFTLGILLFCLIDYIVVVLVLGQTALGNFMQPQLEGIPFDLFQSSKAVLAVFLTPFALVLDFAAYKVMKYVYPTELDKVRRMHYYNKVSPTQAE